MDGYMPWWKESIVEENPSVMGTRRLTKMLP